MMYNQSRPNQQSNVANILQTIGGNKDPVQQAWNELAERVSIAGWKEALTEAVSTIRRFYQVILLVLSGLCLYYSYLVIRQWRLSGYKDEIEDLFEQNQLPFTNVTICAQVYLNQSFVMQNISVPEIILQRYRGHTGLSSAEFYRLLTLYLSFMMRPRPISLLDTTYFSKIIKANPQLEDYSAWLEDASLKCPDMLRKCWFNQMEFDCCKMAARSIDEDGICYILALNMDSNNAFPSNTTFQQSQPGPAGGLTVEASVNLIDFPWLENDADNGYRVYINPVPYSLIQSPLGAPAGAETFIKVKPSKRQLSTNCAAHNDLGRRVSFMYYDPDGFDCMIEAADNTILKYASCLPPNYFVRPNSSAVCNPAALFVAVTAFVRPDLEQYFGSLSGASELNRGMQVVTNLQVDWRAAFSEGSMCKKHCARWTYDSTSSFVNLESPISNDNRMFSRINVYYGELSYRKYNQAKEYPDYVAFCDFGNVIGLYWGMSIVSFLHFSYYVTRYVYIRRSNRLRRVGSDE